jgi:hypothetical protein
MKDKSDSIGMLGIPHKDFKDVPELKEVMALVQEINAFLKDVSTVYRTHNHKESFFNDAFSTVEKKWLKLEFIYCSSSMTRRKALPAEIKIETDSKKIKKQLEDFRIRWLMWKKEYMKKGQE